jgi:hypothetical protein
MEEIFKIREDKERAQSIFEIAKDRYNLIKIYPREKVYKIIEEYYETIKELILSLMYFRGYKTLSHIKMIEWVKEEYKNFEEKEIRLIDSLRKLRNGTLYYGEKSNIIFLDNNEKDIKLLTAKLIKFTGEKING